MRVFALMNRFGERIKCGTCGQRLKSGRSRQLIDYALMHMGKPLYQCRLCKQGTHNNLSAVAHIRKAHRVSTVGNIDDDSDLFHDEIMDTISKCYDYDSAIGESNRPPASCIPEKVSLGVCRSYSLLFLCRLITVYIVSFTRNFIMKVYYICIVLL